MNCIVIYILIAIIFLALLKLNGEHFAFQEQVDACDRWDGKVKVVDGVTVCELPKVIKNNSLMNWQLAGKVCDIDHLMLTQGCKNPWYETNPYTVSASRGIYKWSS